MTDVEETEVDLVAQRKGRAKQQRQAIRLRNKLQIMLDEEDPATLSLHKLQEKETEVETVIRRGNRCNDLLVDEETDEHLLEEDETAWDLFQTTTDLATRLCQELIALRTVSSLVEEVDSSLLDVQTKREEDPTGDYSDCIPAIRELLHELNETLRGSTIPAGHNLRTMAKELSSRLNKAQAKKMDASSEDTKDFPRKDSNKSSYKRAALTVPTFSGQLKDWQPFWKGFSESVQTSPIHPN